jgi:hypothetical protein
MVESLRRQNSWVTFVKERNRFTNGLHFVSTLLFAFLFLFASCSKHAPVTLMEASPATEQMSVAKTGFVIQVGAFRSLDNAVRLTLSLNEENLGAYYFKHESGLYKVRFGSYLSLAPAKENAERLKDAGLIQEYFIVNPGSLLASRALPSGFGLLRQEIVDRALSYLGLPYRWGGYTPETGFDCSGLTMAVYSLVGLDLPRTSLAQFRSGTPVQKNSIRRGDLVFFQSPRRNRISHVGIYTGDGNFIHAPGENKLIRIDSLSDEYIQENFVGARTYLSPGSRD